MSQYYNNYSKINHEGSDLDLAIISENEPLTQQQLSAVRDAFSESNLPILIDILNWDIIPNEFKQEIKKEHIVIQLPRNKKN